MKVIDGGFGKSEGPVQDPYERLQEQLATSGLEGAPGQYMVIWDRGDAMVMLSNMESAGDVYIHCAKAQAAIMATQFGNIYEDDDDTDPAS